MTTLEGDHVSLHGDHLSLHGDHVSLGHTSKLQISVIWR